MAEIHPIRALRYDPHRTGGLQDVVAPPYDVIDEEQRAALEARSPYNVVRIDLPVSALIAAGFRVAGSEPGATIGTEVLVGQDGRFHAVRLISARSVQ